MDDDDIQLIRAPGSADSAAEVMELLEKAIRQDVAPSSTQVTGFVAYVAVCDPVNNEHGVFAITGGTNTPSEEVIIKVLRIFSEG